MSDESMVPEEPGPADGSDGTEAAGTAPGRGSPGSGARRIRLAALAASCLAAAALGYGAWQALRPARAAAGAGTGAPPAAPDGSASERPAPAALPNAPDAVSVVFSDVVLSPPARVQAEKFRCVCGCGMVLGDCTCTKTPGSIDMKQHLQALVDRGLPPAEIQRGMVEKYGRAVLP